MNQHPLLCSALLTVLTAATIAAVAEDNPLKGDLAKLQGKWTATVEIGPGNKHCFLFQFEGNTLRIRATTSNRQESERTVKFKIDESGTPHKAMDWITRIDVNGVERSDVPAIYAFENDDILKICQPVVLSERPERPKEFGPAVPGPGAVGSSTFTFTFTRVKETAKPAP